MMLNVFSKVLLISIMGSALIVLILIVKAVFKEKLSVRWHYYIWLLLVARLLIPYTPEISINLNDLFQSAQHNIINQMGTEVTHNEDNDSKADFKNNSLENVFKDNDESSLAMTDNMESSENKEIIKSKNSKLEYNILKTGSKIWIIGVISFVLYIFIIDCMMHYRINMTGVSNEYCNILNILDNCKKILSIDEEIPIVYQNHIKTPAVYGIFKTKMLMPAGILDQISQDEIRYIILHELCHFKRKDTAVGMLQMLLCVLHWFNPLIWFAFNRMKEDRELVCDELVLSYIKLDERRKYAETLIKILACFSENRMLYSTANMSQGSIANMEWRLKMINILKKRSVILGCIIAMVTITLGAAAVLSINKHLNFTYSVNAADTNLNTAISEEHPTRGEILDRNGNVLAVSISAYTIALNPGEIEDSGQNANLLAETLSEVLILEKEFVMEKAVASSKYEILKRKVDKETGDKIREWINNNNIKGVIINDDSKRFYPNDQLAAHVIGFTGVYDQGLGGIELSMEKYLKLKGTDISIDGKKTLESGMSVVLTLDIGIQDIVDNALDKAIEEYKVMNGAAAIVMNPKNGEILAMVSKPDFNLNKPYSSTTEVDSSAMIGNTEADIKKLSDTIWKNKTLTDTYEPGAVFKAITSAAGLEVGVVTPETLVDDATVSISGWDINCWDPNAHGKETFKEAVYNSCNPVFVKVAQSLGIDKFYTYVREFGFYDRTGLELPGEAKGLIHSKPMEVDMAVASFGQRFQVTPIQVVSAYGAIANDGKLMKPQIIKKLTDKEKNEFKVFEPQVIRNVVSPRTASNMKVMLEGVVSRGTGVNAYIESYKIAGSTGTGEKMNGKYVTSFAGFAPADDPKIVCIIILDEPMGNLQTGGMTAAPVAGKVMKAVLDYLSR